MGISYPIFSRLCRRSPRLSAASAPQWSLLSYKVYFSRASSGDRLGTVSYTHLDVYKRQSMVFVMLTMSLASARRIAQVLNEQPDLADPQRPVTQVENGSIDFDHVSFSYKHGTGDQVLQDVDLHIRSGETIGVIGGTGSGKSTFANLISRLYDVDAGTVKVSGVDVRRYDMEALRNQVAVVLQKNVLFSGTILDNLRWGKEDATLEECQAACQAAYADEFINRFPEGYNTWIEQGGTNVSGGQKQRLCIARALLKRPKVLILDDSTSAVAVSYTHLDVYKRQASLAALP